MFSPEKPILPSEAIGECLRDEGEAPSLASENNARCVVFQARNPQSPVRFPRALAPRPVEPRSRRLNGGGGSRVRTHLRIKIPDDQEDAGESP